MSSLTNFGRQIIKLFMNEEEAHNNTRPKKIRSKRSKYSKISLKSKIVFFQKVIHEQADLREVAKKLGIKYSTAKTLVRNYKRMPEEANLELVRKVCSDFECKFKARRRCSYQMIEDRTQASESSIKQQYLGLYMRPGKIQLVCSLTSGEDR